MWEYELVEETNEKKLVAKLDEYGAKNWEVCGFTCYPGAMGRGHHFVLLKRQKDYSVSSLLH